MNDVSTTFGIVVLCLKSVVLSVVKKNKMNHTFQWSRMLSNVKQLSGGVPPYVIPLNSNMVADHSIMLSAFSSMRVDGFLKTSRYRGASQKPLPLDSRVFF